MKYATANAFRTALEARLLAQAAHDQAALVRFRKLVVFERLVARLLAVSSERWVVKGGVALDFRYGDRARATVDLDLARRDHEAYATEDMVAVQSVSLDDFFAFKVSTIHAVERSMHSQLSVSSLQWATVHIMMAQ